MGRLGLLLDARRLNKYKTERSRIEKIVAEASGHDSE